MHCLHTKRLLLSARAGLIIFARSSGIFDDNEHLQNNFLTDSKRTTISYILSSDLNKNHESFCRIFAASRWDFGIAVGVLQLRDASTSFILYAHDRSYRIFSLIHQFDPNILQAQAQASKLSKQRLGGARAANITDDAQPDASTYFDSSHSKVSGSKTKPNIDVGIFNKTTNKALDPAPNMQCTEFNECDYGYVKGTNVSCEVGCEDDNGIKRCCAGSYSCWLFTGKVCKDGYSCNGDFACFETKIDEVVHGCNGDSACDYAGINGVSFLLTPLSLQLLSQGLSNNIFPLQSIGKVDHGCNGPAACMHAGEDSGKIEAIEKSSCVGDQAC